MVSQKVTVKNPNGIHMRPAKKLCDTAMEFSSLITVTFGRKTVNAKSILGVLGACVKCGDEIELVCEGADETEALAVLTAEIENGLGEEA